MSFLNDEEFFQMAIEFVIKLGHGEVSLRTLLDPREGVRYVGAVSSRLVKLSGGLVLRAIVTTDTVVEVPALPANVRKIS